MSEFCCYLCNFASRYDYFGRKPPFCESITLMEKAYVMKNPFTPHDSHLTIGAHCSECERAVCVQQSCSVFYTRRFCKKCVDEHREEFPSEITEVISKG